MATRKLNMILVQCTTTAKGCQKTMTKLYAGTGMPPIKAMQELSMPLVRCITTALACRRIMPRRINGSAKLRPKAIQKLDRSEERRVGKECRSRWSPDHY